MVALIGGNSLGLNLASTGIDGQTGKASLGRSGEAVHVNAANGNLVIQDRDELVVSRGLDALVLRTYNSQGRFDDDNGDNWRLGVHKRLSSLTGTLGSAGSSLVRTDADG